MLSKAIGSSCRNATTEEFSKPNPVLENKKFTCNSITTKDGFTSYYRNDFFLQHRLDIFCYYDIIITVIIKLVIYNLIILSHHVSFLSFRLKNQNST